MRIFVFSDTHGMWKNLLPVLAAEAPDLILHLGDHVSDAECLRSRTHCPLLSVAGNSVADRVSNAPDHRTVTLEGHTLYLCHGHLHHVKNTLLYLTYAAREQNASIALFGHTHRPCDEECDGLRLVNPGSAQSTYAVLTLTADRVTCEHRPIPQ